MMKKVTMLVFVLMLCITGIARAVELPACIGICYPSNEAGATVTMIAYDESGAQINLNETDLIEINFENAENDPTGFCVLCEEENDFDAVVTEEGTLQFTMIEAFYNHNRWTFGVIIEGVFWNFWVVVPEYLAPGSPEECTDCGGGENLNWPPIHRFVVDVIADGSTCELTPDCPVPTILVSGGEVAEEGTTSAELTIQLDRNPTAPVTITIAEPVGEDPNISDPEAFTITGAAGSPGVATVIIPADSNSATITVTAIDDTAIEGNLGYGLVVESWMDPNVAGFDPNLVTGADDDPNAAALVSAGIVTVIDNDTRSLVVDPDYVFVSESDDPNDPNSWVCVDVKLSHVPLGEVNVAVEMIEWAWDIGMLETDANLVDPNYLQFNVGDWDIAQQVCFKAIYVEGRANVEEAMALVPAYCLLNPRSSADPAYDPDTGIEPGAEVFIEVEDIDCGSYGFDERDYNEDCFVNLEDFAEFARGWMICNNPGDPACD